MADKFDSLANKIDILTEKISDVSSKLEVHIVRFDAHANREDALGEALHRQVEILQENTDSLKDHIRRTDLLETYVKNLDGRFTPIELENLRKKAVADWWKNRVWFLAKLGGALGALGAMLGGLKWFIGSL